MDEKYLSFLYNRVFIDENDKYEVYVYDFLGLRVCVLGDGCLLFDDKKYYFINDVSHVQDNGVFAFPYKLSEEEIDNIDEVISCFDGNIESLSDGIFYQVYEKSSSEIKTYYLNSSESNFYFEVNMDSIDGLKDVFDEKRKEIGEISSTLKKALIDAKKEDKKLSSCEIFDNVSKSIMCQDEQIKSIISNIIKNTLIHDERLKTNLFVCGDHGVGKTDIFRCLEENLDVPLVIKDITSMDKSAEKSVSDLIYSLYLKANGDLDKVQRGVIVIDCIDKDIEKFNGSVNTNSYLDELLRISKGYKFHFDISDNSFDVDASFITFVFISNFIKKIGYSYDTLDSSKNDKTVLSSCGINSEFSYSNNVVVFNSLDMNDYFKIISESDKSMFLLYKYMIEELGVKLIYDDACINAIAKKAVELGVGLHSLKSITSKAFEVILYNLYSDNKYSEVVILPETFEDNKKFILK